MKSQTLLSVLSTFFLLFITLTAAWPELYPARPGALIARQDSESAQPTASETASESASPSTTAAPDENNNDNNNDNEINSNSESNSESNTESDREDNTASQSGSRVSSSGTARVTSGSRNSTRTQAIDPRLPPGGLSMITPAATDGMTFVKVGNQVTFKWNYTSLSVKPQYIDVVATNTINHQTYTIAGNLSFEETQAVTWDTNEFTKTTDLPFVIATYTLMVYDASTDPTDAPKAGYLGAYSQLQFGIYTPQPYTPLNEFRCATCGGAMSLHEKQALGILLGTCTITVLSFTWFASGVFGVF